MLSRASLLFVRLAASFALAVPASAPLFTTQAAEEATPPTASKFEFDVASIRQNTSIGGHNHIYNDPHNGEFRTINAPLKMILEYAYDMPQPQIVGGPAWIDFAKFDIDAKSDEAVSAALANMPSSEGRERKRGMVRTLLEDRFGLVVHRETRELPVFDLVLAKGGAKIEKSDVNGTTVNEGKGHIYVEGSDHTVTLFCESLAQATGRVVVDKTGLDGRYKIGLKWTPDDVLAAGGGGPDAPPGLFTAIQEQVGFKLESSKAPVPVLMIDKAEMPSEN